MTAPIYRPDPPASPLDIMILAGAGPEPLFDAVMGDFLREGHRDLKQSCARGGLLNFASLGLGYPWVYRLTFRTRGLVRRGNDEITTVDFHVVALRFLPEYLRHADRYSMLRLIEPGAEIFHPNVSPVGAICLEIYPGESPIEICHSLHDLFRWRLRQYDERDALNPAACAWGRQHVDRPIDERPLFGQRLQLKWQVAAKPTGGGA